MLNVTVPAGSMTTFGATINAVQALGYSEPDPEVPDVDRRDVLCGIASMYNDDRDTQANKNNGSYAQYARIDAVAGAGRRRPGHSVEAHELVHTLGGVQGRDNHSAAGHCSDESDTMCYKDGAATMVQVCPAEREYFSTATPTTTSRRSRTRQLPRRCTGTPPTRASSIGGGDGSGGGASGTPPVLGATIGVNNPAVPGLSTQVEVKPVLPPGRTITSVDVEAGATASFSAPTALQSDVTCNASATGATDRDRDADRTPPARPRPSAAR